MQCTVPCIYKLLLLHCSSIQTRTSTYLTATMQLSRSFSGGSLLCVYKTTPLSNSISVHTFNDQFQFAAQRKPAIGLVLGGILSECVRVTLD